MGDTSGEVSMASSEGSLLQNHHKTTKHPCGSSFCKAREIHATGGLFGTFYETCFLKVSLSWPGFVALERDIIGSRPWQKSGVPWWFLWSCSCHLLSAPGRFYSLLNQHLLVWDTQYLPLFVRSVLCVKSHCVIDDIHIMASCHRN